MLQRMTIALWASLLMFLLFSCKKNNDGSSDTGAFPVGVATPAGTPDGSPANQKTIGTEGGTIASTDGRLKLTIPAGALSAAQQFSIQPISNHNPLAIGKAYRLEPHNVTFSTPVTVEFAYNDDDIKNTIPEALGIAYQDAKGIWQAQGSAVTDKVNKTVKVSATHFSDWSLFESFYLISSATILPVNGTAELEIFTTGDLLANLTPGKEVPMGEKVSMSASYIKEWKLAGAGNLQPNGAKAVYKAPSEVPGSPNPVAVSVSLDLKQRGKFLLVRHIEITSDDGEIEVRVAGGPWIKNPASPAVKIGNDYSIAWIDGETMGGHILIRWAGCIGTHAYRSPLENYGTYVHYLVNNGNGYVCYYRKNEDELVASGGGVTITSMGDDGEFVKGSFTVTPAGYGDDLRSTTTLEGRFRVRKAF